MTKDKEKRDAVKYEGKNGGRRLRRKNNPKATRPKQKKQSKERE